MRRPRVSASSPFVLPVLLVLLSGCGGSSADPTSPATPVATTITIAPNLTLLTGQTGQLIATIRDQNGATMAGQTVTWQTLTGGIVTVSTSGLVTAVAAGAGTISATVGSATANVGVTVSARAPTAMTLTPDVLNVDKGDTLRVVAAVTDQAGDPLPGATVTWVSDATGIATVSTSGLVTALAAGSAMITATAGSVTKNAPVTVTDQPGPYSVDTNLDVVSVAAGATDTVKVYAIDVDNYDVTPFQFATSGSCVSVTSNGTTELYVTAVAPLCSQNILLNVPGDDKIITARGYSPSYIDLGDGLVMAYTNQWTQVYTDGAWHSSGLTPSRAFRPILFGAGWYSVGDHLQNNYDWIPDDGTAAAIQLYDLAGNNLAAPTGYVKIWDNSIEGCIVCSNRTASAAWWKPVCPVGFEPLGSVASGGGVPSLDQIRCVSNRYTTRAQVEEVNAWYSDMNSGSSEDIRMYKASSPVDQNKRADGRATLYARSQFGCPSYDIANCDSSFFNLLLVPMPVVQRGDDTRPLRQDASFQPREQSSALIRVPFTLVPSLDPTCGSSACTGASAGVANMVTNSPFVYLKRSNAYVLLAGPTSFVNNPGTIEYQLQNCFSSSVSTSFSQSIGLSVTVTAEAEFEGIGGSVGVTLSQEFGWSVPRAQEFSTCSTTVSSYPIAQGYVAAVVSERETFSAVSEQGATVGTPFPIDGAPLIQLLKWVP